MIRLKLPGIGVVSYHKNKPPDTILFAEFVGNKDFSSIVWPLTSQCDFEYERNYPGKLFKLVKT